MELLITIFDTVLYQPLFNILILFYKYLPGHDFGVAIITLTILIKILLYPLDVRTIKSQIILQKLQPKIQEIQRVMKDDKEKQIRAIMDIYKKEKINPLTGIFPLLIQLPILIALYRVFWRGLRPEEMTWLYGFLSVPGQINPNFLGMFNLSRPNLILAVFVGICQFIQTKLISSFNKTKNDSQEKNQELRFSEIFQKQMLYFFPVLTVLILLSLPSALGLYWLVIILFSIFQQYLIFKHQKNK